MKLLIALLLLTITATAQTSEPLKFLVQTTNGGTYLTRDYLKLTDYHPVTGLNYTAGTLTLNRTGLADISTAIPNYWTASGTNIYNTNSGGIGIGTTNPVTKLDVRGTVGFQTATASFSLNSNISLTTSPGNPINLSCSQNSTVGIYSGYINFYSPVYDFIAGTIKYETGAGEGKILTSDASGNATWQTPIGAGGSSPLAEYADNSAATAAGLTAGAFYRTGDVVKVVH